LKMKNFVTLTVGSGHMAYCHVAFIDLYNLHTYQFSFKSDDFLETGGCTYVRIETSFIKLAQLRSRHKTEPNKNSKKKTAEMMSLTTDPRWRKVKWRLWSKQRTWCSRAD